MLAVEASWGKNCFGVLIYLSYLSPFLRETLSVLDGAVQ